MSLIVDVRERELIPMLAQSSPVVRQLAIGDVWIGASLAEENGAVVPNRDGLIVERKTVRDLEASVLDGRYREQKTRLLAYCQETGAQPLYVIEGNYASTTGRLQVSALMKIVARLQYKYKIPVMHTQNTGETAILVQALYAYWQEDATNFCGKDEPLRAVEGVHVQKKANAAEPYQFAVAAIAQCPGVSVKAAEAIMTEFKTLGALMQADVATIAKVQNGTRKIGPVVAGRLKGVLQHTSE